MKFQKVKMIVEFNAPVGHDAYSRGTSLPWQKYAEHDMLNYLKDHSDFVDHYVYIDTIKFEWGNEFEKKVDWEE